jgi:hypothetical protein
MADIDLSNLGSCSCATESDVEQKIIWPLLTASEWLAHKISEVDTKKYLPATDIGKGAKAVRGYIPDYAIWLEALPVLIGEAKSPMETAEKGFIEAQLYAHELNKRFPPGVNPCNYVFSTNGRTLLVGLWDAAKPALQLEVSDLVIGSAAHDRLRSLIGSSALHIFAQNVRKRFRPVSVSRPIDHIGGDATLNRSLGYNSFAVDLSPLIRMYFVSDSAERVDDIIKKAYVPTSEITRYDQLLETFLRERVDSISAPGSRQIETTKKRENLLTPELQSFASRMPSTGHVQLLIGPVGAGKTLFCQRYYGYLQSDDVKRKTFWSFLDFNTAPADLIDPDRWVCNSFIESFSQRNADIDLSDPDCLSRVFAPDVTRIRAMFAKASKHNPGEVELRVADRLLELTKDPVTFAKALCRYIIGDARKAVVVVFDNVDRRDRDQQLRIFQVCQWFRSETRAFCLISLRDETYEQYKREPPLDAFVNAIHFTIIPPRFIDVVKKRLELALDYIANDAPDTLEYHHSDGKKITYPSTRLGLYLKTIYSDMFSNSRKVSWLLEALAGRNVRNSLEMFVRVLMSGHLDERLITGTILGSEEYRISEAQIIKILMRTNYLYYAEDHGFIPNILYTSEDWTRPSNLLISEILSYLIENRKRVGSLGIQGYFAVHDICSMMTRLGFLEEDVISACEYMLKSKLINADHMRRVGISRSDHVRAHSAGFITFRFLVERLEYVSGIAPATYFADRDIARTIAERWTISPGFHDIQHWKKKEVVYRVVEYLKDQYNDHSDASPVFQQYARGSRYVIRKMESILTGHRPNAEIDSAYNGTNLL